MSGRSAARALRTLMLTSKLVAPVPEMTRDEKIAALHQELATTSRRCKRHDEILQGLERLGGSDAGGER